MKLTDICEFHGGSQPPKSEWSSEYKDGYIRMLQIRDFTQEGRVTPEYVKISNRLRLCTEDDILIGRYGASVGKILSGKSGAYNVAIMKAVPDTSVVRKQYLRYYFLSPNFQNYILNLGGRAAQAGFSKDDLARLEITVVSLEEQDKIVNELSTLEKTISTKQKQLKEFDDLVKSRFIEMFVEKGFKEITFSDYAEIIDGDRGKNYPKAEEFSDEGYCLFLSAKNVTKDGFLFEQMQFISEEKDNLLRKGKLCRGDIVITTRGTIGNIAFYDDDIPYDNVRINSGMVIIRQKEVSFNQVFFLNAFKNKIDEIKETNVTGAAQPQLPIHIMSKIKLLNPPIELQNEFADFVKLIDKSKFVGYFILNIFYVKSSHFHHPP